MRTDPYAEYTDPLHRRFHRYFDDPHTRPVAQNKEQVWIEKLYDRWVEIGGPAAVDRWREAYRTGATPHPPPRYDDPVNDELPRLTPELLAPKRVTAEDRAREDAARRKELADKIRADAARAFARNDPHSPRAQETTPPPRPHDPEAAARRKKLADKNRAAAARAFARNDPHNLRTMKGPTP